MVVDILIVVKYPRAILEERNTVFLGVVDNPEDNLVVGKIEDTAAAAAVVEYLWIVDILADNWLPDMGLDMLIVHCIKMVGNMMGTQVANKAEDKTVVAVVLVIY